MENNELLSQISSLLENQTERMQRQMDERFAEQGQRIDERFAEQNQRIERLEKRFEEHTQQIDEKMKTQTMELATMMEAQMQKISLMIENHITKRIDSLFDGYKLTHEKQWEMERQSRTVSASDRKPSNSCFCSGESYCPLIFQNPKRL